MYIRVKNWLLTLKHSYLRNLNLDFNLSENYSYSIFPKPNFTFKESSFLNEVENLGEIKVYISSKNLIPIFNRVFINQYI